MSRVSRRDFIGAAVAVTGGSVLRAQNAASASFVRTPYVQNVSSSEATILWTTSQEQASRVVISDSDGNIRAFEASSTRFEAAVTGLDATFYQYKATLTGLAPASRYRYQVEASGIPLTSPLSRALEFRTPGPGAFQFLHLADSGAGTADQFSIARLMNQQSADLVLANGDLAYDLATYSSIEGYYYTVYRELMAQVPFFASLGNHEYYTDSAAPSLSGRVHPTNGVPVEDWGRYYSFDWGNAHFVALDSNAPLQLAAEGTGPMLRWLEQDLANTRKFWRIAFFHHPGYATGNHAAEPEAGRVRANIVPILEKYGVQLVLNGHEHTYQRTYPLRAGEIVEADLNGIVYVTSGGGGASPNYFDPNARIVKSVGVNHYLRADVSGSSMQVHVLSQAGEVDSLSLQPKPQISTVLNAASFTPDLAGGSAISIFGRHLFPEMVTGGSTEAHGCSVLLNAEALPLVFADALQINVQLPPNSIGEGKLEVRTPNGSAITAIQIKATAPALFASPSDPGSALATTRGAFITPDHPASIGDTVCLFATGLRAGDPVTVRFGDIDIGGQAVAAANGVWEVFASLPATSGAPSLSVQLRSGDAFSNSLRLAVE